MAIAALSLVTGSSFTKTGENKPKVLITVFEGETPLSGSVKSILKGDGDVNCDRIKWKLTLYQDRHTLKPINYKLERTYGLPKDRAIAASGPILEMKGTWTITKGTKNNPNAVVYQLMTDDNSQQILFEKKNDNTLSLVKTDKSLVKAGVGKAFTMHKVDI